MGSNGDRPVHFVQVEPADDRVEILLRMPNLPTGPQFFFTLIEHVILPSGTQVLVHKVYQKIKNQPSLDWGIVGGIVTGKTREALVLNIQ